MAATPDRPTHVALHKTGIRSVTAHLLLTSASAVMLAFAFAPSGLWWVAYVALVPAGLLAARSGSGWRLMWTSFAVFWLWWLVMIAWVAPVTQGGYVALSALMASYGALALVVARALHNRYRIAMVVLLPIAWISCEWLRIRFLAGGFGWFAIGHTQASFQVGQSPGRIVQIADLFGEQGVGLVVLMSSGLIVDLLTRPIRQPIGHGKHRLHPVIRGGLILWLLAFCGSWFYGNYRIDQWDKATGPGVRIAVVQTNVPQDNKVHRTPLQDAQDWDRMVELTRQAADMSNKPDLIVWPETVSPSPVNPEAIAFFREVDSYYSGREVYHEMIGDLAKSLGVNLLVGSSAYEAFTEVTFPSGAVGPFPSRRYNSAFLYEIDGRQAPMRYDKIHRVPFGEYIPWVSAFPAIKALFIKWFTPYDFDYSLVGGSRLTVFDIPVSQVSDGPPIVRVVTPICFDDVVGRVIRPLVYRADGTKRADLIVNLTNSAWFTGQTQQPQHLQIATLRCIENRVPMASSVNGGISGFIDSIGRVGPVVTRDGQSQWVDGVLLAEPQLDDRRTLYGRIGEWPITCLAWLTAWLLIWGKIMPRRSVD